MLGAAIALFGVTSQIDNSTKNVSRQIEDRMRADERVRERRL